MMIKSAVKWFLCIFGYEATKIRRFSGSYDPYCHLLPGRRIVDLEKLSNIALTVPGMISVHSGQMLYSMCALQETQGDVVEIGSWQGRSTSFLARAVEESGNGTFYAIDHFRGNVGKEATYVVGAPDLSDLQKNFVSNMSRLDLLSAVNLLDMPTEEAALKLSGIKVRFLFIDGDHTYEGVKKDLQLFSPMLSDDALIVFDDFSENFPGLIEAVNEFVAGHMKLQSFAYENTLVLKLAGRSQ